MDINLVFLIIGIAGFVIMLSLLTVIMIMQFINHERVNRVILIDHRLISIEKYLENLSEEVDASLEPSPSVSGVWKSADGRFSASSMQELIEQMTEAGAIDGDGNSLESDEDDGEQLKNFFESEEEDDDEDNEEWKNK